MCSVVVIVMAVVDIVRILVVAMMATATTAAAAAAACCCLRYDNFRYPVACRATVRKEQSAGSLATVQFGLDFCKT